MPRFFITAGQIGVRDDGTKTAIITGDDASHITRSLRMKEGEKLTLCDMARREYECTVLSVGENVTVSIDSEHVSETEPPYVATVYQALVKGDKFDTVVQKAIECGATYIVPFISSRCIVRLDKKDAEKKIVRWQRIATEAAKQCGRGVIPTVMPLMTFDEAVKSAAECDIPLLCYEAEDGTTIKGAIERAEGHDTISIMIGSEGGFSVDEAKKAQAAGLVSCGLGKRILRTETASSFALSCISYALEL